MGHKFALSHLRQALTGPVHLQLTPSPRLPMILMSDISKGILKDIAKSGIPGIHLKTLLVELKPLTGSIPSFLSFPTERIPRAVPHLLCSLHPWDSAALPSPHSVEDLAIHFLEKSKGSLSSWYPTLATVVLFHLSALPSHHPQACDFLPKAHPFTLSLALSPASLSTDYPSLSY